MLKTRILFLVMLMGALGCTKQPVGICEVCPNQNTIGLNGELNADQKAFFAKNYLPCKQRNKKKDPEALFNVGVAVLNGLGTDKDASKAFLWFKAAGDKKHKQAQKILSQMFAGGVGIFKDPLIAQKYEAASLHP